jgi:aminopeptidase N
MVRDAQLPATQFLKAVHNNTAIETESGLLALVLSQAATAITGFLAPELRDAASAELVATLAAALKKAPAGTDLQRAWVNALARTGAESKSSVSSLREVLEGKIFGLELTPTLRWQILVSLASLGETDDAELEVEYKRDPTMTGATALARARASFPGADVKAKVWDELTGTVTITNDRQNALISGFNEGEFKDRAQFVTPYFGSLTRWWGAMSMTMASRLVRGLFPSTTIEFGPVGSNEIERAAQVWLDDNEKAPKALRRIVIEALDGTRRQLRAQAV